MLAMYDETSGFMRIDGVFHRSVDPEQEKIPEERLVKIDTGSKTWYFTPIPTVRELWEDWIAVREELGMGEEVDTYNVTEAIKRLQYNGMSY